MFKRLWVRNTIIIVLALVLGFLDLPGSYKKQVLGDSNTGIAGWANSVNFHLGLDLQGGTQLRYRVDTSSVPALDRGSVVEGIKNVIERRINNLGIAEAVVQSSQLGADHYIIVELPGVKDINEAIKRVGKTVQLEFKEQREDWTTEEKKANDQFNAGQTKKGNDILKEAQKSGTDFGKLVREKSEGRNIAQDGIIDFETEEYVDPAVWPQLSQLKVDQVAMVEAENGIYIMKVLETKKEPKEISSDEKITANHILVAYKGATRADSAVSRSKEEAKQLADEIKGRVNKDNFGVQAKEYSNDTSNKDKGGSLGSFARGQMVKAFEDAAFGANKGDIIGPVETEFGYHIIQVTDKVAPEKKMEEILKIKRQEIFLKKMPPKPLDGWVSTGLTGKQFTHASAQPDPSGRGFAVALQFNEEGKKLFGDITKRNLGKPVAIFLDDVLISQPKVNSAITDGQAIIQGTFSAGQASQLASDLNTGALPAPIVLIGQNTVGATLGQDALHKALQGGALGLLLLALFMIIYYRLPGLIAILALGIYGIISAAIFQLGLPFIGPITLTLAGIAGFVLSIGMAVDANILIFERLKEELLSGKTLDGALKAGFARAWSSIRDSNLSSLITCAILAFFGTAVIKGFAITLAIGILVSMFTAITITRSFLEVALRWFKQPNLWKCGFSDRVAQFPFVAKSNLFFGITGVLVLITLISLFTRGLVQGIDLTGGTLMEVRFKESVTTEQVQQALESTYVEKPAAFIPVAYAQQKGESAQENPALENAPLQEAESNPDLSNSVVQPAENNTFIIRMKHIGSETRTKIMEAFKAINGNTDVEQLRFETIGPTIGATLRENAYKSVGLAIIFMILFVAYAFRKVPKTLSPWRFGIVAVIVLLHDVILTLGLFSLLGLEIDTLFITAILTVMGFSMHDTIVVFDRIRENVAKSSGKESIENIVDASLNQTFARSLNTSFTVLITLAALYILASSAIQNFVLALLFGIAMGTYSSIAVAAPLLVLWYNAAMAKKPMIKQKR
ncbi:MAG: protein translocase subunit SecD [Candidatus Abawacabacteria bacterium]|nr:protein translocase subunit SecD [Candidatus Abawacabacteria bacterium]